ncbi:hypothetical protein CDAR_403471 [Caerostris darwini]|uniref:Kinesin motor domain-containing protein n=1 Tax=Caerostris darwini TaxID=1538125 RepID=A0AAV4N583_9ARAC|nr:hypothetical protein CDAR_403471 [Caerostris darwini]
MQFPGKNRLRSVEELSVPWKEKSTIELKMALEMDEQKMFFVLRCSPMKYGEEAEDIIFKQNGEVQAMGRTYHFDNVFPSCASNEEIYRTVIAEKMQLILEGNV